MKTLILFLLVAFLAGADDQSLAGTYTGDWTGGTASGNILLKFEQAEGKWSCEASFTLSGADVKTVTKSVKVDGNKIEVKYEFDLQGNKLMSTVTGQLQGRTLEGKYETVTVPDGGPVDAGTWKAKAAAK
jgi:hypothetical protein